ncbi:hypothetical protein DM02DRAFT_369532, partial [Periconia macrospinosa]
VHYSIYELVNLFNLAIDNCIFCGYIPASIITIYIITNRFNVSALCLSEASSVGDCLIVCCRLMKSILNYSIGVINRRLSLSGGRKSSRSWFPCCVGSSRPVRTVSAPPASVGSPPETRCTEAGQKNTARPGPSV